MALRRGRYQLPPPTSGVMLRQPTPPPAEYNSVLCCFVPLLLKLWVPAVPQGVATEMGDLVSLPSRVEREFSKSHPHWSGQLLPREDGVKCHLPRFVISAQ